MGHPHLPPAQGLYRPELEHDSCGVGFVVSLKGHRTHQLVSDGISALEHLNHRGASGSEPNTGDGAGIHVEIPQDFFADGLTDALISVSGQSADVRVEGFTTHRSPGRLLPSTSLFSVLGDFAATTFGTTVRYRAFPRLELVGTGSAQLQGGAVGGQGLGRATLALDD